jgi:hypothetical protein
MSHSRMPALLFLPQLLALACAREPAQRLLAPPSSEAMVTVASIEEGPRFGEWSAAVNVGPVVNSAVEDLTPAISKDGLSLYFGSPRPLAGMGGTNIWVSHRASVDAPWDAPRQLGANINAPQPATNNGAAPSRDGHLLYFQSTRPGGFGGLDLWVSRRKDKNDDDSWGDPVNLGAGINTAANEAGLTFFEDEEGVPHFYFQSNRPGGLGGNDIYYTTLLSDGTFTAPVPVTELNSAADDQRAAVRHDGLELYLSSTRAGTMGGMDVWVSTRPTVASPWSTPVNVGAAINTVNFDAAPSLSGDGTQLYFHSALRPGNITERFDLWVATRTRITGAAIR